MRTTIDKHSLIAAWPLYALLAALLILGGYFLGAWENSGDGYVAPLVPSCVFEDGPGPCYWDADTQGNGIGDDVFVNSDGTSVTVND
jgi:hypothetical protein